MVKFVPKEINDNVNVAKDDPLLTFFKAAIGLMIITAVAFVFLATLSEFMIRFMPQRINDSLAKIFSTRIETSQAYETEREKLQVLLDALVERTDFKGQSFRVEIIEADYKNAMAFPGRKIAFTSELLQDLTHENEVVMILGHELGHYQNNDHLRSLSRGVILMGIFSLLEVGGVGNATQLVSGTANLYQLKYSRNQESQADEFGLSLLHQHYGHVSGAVSTFEHLYQQGEELATLNGIFSTHPITKERIRNLKNLIINKKYVTPEGKELIPYSFTIPADDTQDQDKEDKNDEES